MKTIEEINQHNVKKILSEKKIPEFFAGDVVKVGVRITEGKKERIQYFEGVCIAKKNRVYISIFLCNTNTFEVLNSFSFTLNNFNTNFYCVSRRKVCDFFISNYLFYCCFIYVFNVFHFFSLNIFSKDRVSGVVL